MSIGHFYKLQIAFKDKFENIGYYSTVIITKFTARPKCVISGLNRWSTNVDTMKYTAIYTNYEDPTEKCYQYCFTLYDQNKEVLETSGWLVHNSANDVDIYTSSDSYIFSYSLQTEERYYVRYQARTNNNLVISSAMYIVIGAVSIDPELTANVKAELAYDDGCINVWLEPYKKWNPLTRKYDPPVLTGSFILSRSSKKDNYTRWITLYYFSLTGVLPQGYIFQDYTVEQGDTYKYSIQQYNQADVYSNRRYSNEVVAHFEDMFLYDGDIQLKIKFNPKVTSFKTVLQDAKKVTIGSKYPFFFRSGHVEYKEFPISGLISYLGDDNATFAERNKDLGMSLSHQDTTDITDENLTYERKFKLKVLDWLNDGKVKLFRSPAEGNYIVRISNVSLQPIDSVSRMIHTFQATVTEIADFNSSNLIYYNFLMAEPQIPTQLRFGTINFSELYQQVYNTMAGLYPDFSASKLKTLTVDRIESIDLLNGFAAKYVKFENCDPMSTFKLGIQTFMIGATGQYEINLEVGQKGLRILNPHQNMSGQVTYGVLSLTTNKFDTIDKIKAQEKFYIGYGQPMPIRNSSYESTWGEGLDADGKWNWIDIMQDVKNSISRIYKMRFSLRGNSVNLDTLKDLYDIYNMRMESVNEWTYKLYNENTLADADLKAWGQIYDTYQGSVSMYINQYDNKEITEEQKNDSIAAAYRKLISDARNIHLHVENEFVPYDSNYGSYGLVNSGYLTNYRLFRDDGAAAAIANNTLFKLSDGSIWWFNWSNDNHMEATLDYAGSTEDYTRVIIDGQEIDLVETLDLTIPNLGDVPKKIWWGALVKAEIIYQTREVIYGVEKNTLTDSLSGSDMPLATLKEQASNAFKLYSAAALDYVCLSSISSMQKSYVQYSQNLINLVTDLRAYPNVNYYIWDNDKFYRIEDADRLVFTGQEVWIPYCEKNAGPWVQSETDPWDNYSIDNLYTTYRNAYSTFLHATNMVLKAKEKEM